ncbi:hypothetical protein [Mitsuaria sp. TWR114]|nr:hypothetical protein [Mitsuaria sp. TWR114]
MVIWVAPLSVIVLPASWTRTPWLPEPLGSVIVNGPSAVMVAPPSATRP